jgi:hypothetical protein
MRSFVDRHKFLKNNPSDVVRAYGLPKPVEEERGMKCSVIWLVLWNGVSDAFFVVSPRLRQHPVSLQHLMAASSVQSQEDEPAIDLNEVSHQARHCDLQGSPLRQPALDSAAVTISLCSSVQRIGERQCLYLCHTLEFQAGIVARLKVKTGGNANLSR